MNSLMIYLAGSFSKSMKAIVLASILFDHTVHQRHQVIVGEHGDDAHNQTAYRSNHGLVIYRRKAG